MMPAVVDINSVVRRERMRQGGRVIRTNKTVDEHVFDKWKVYVGRKGNRIANNYINS